MMSTTAFGCASYVAALTCIWGSEVEETACGSTSGTSGSGSGSSMYRPVTSIRILSDSLICSDRACSHARTGSWSSPSVLPSMLSSKRKTRPPFSALMSPSGSPPWRLPRPRTPDQGRPVESAASRLAQERGRRRAVVGHVQQCQGELVTTTDRQLPVRRGEVRLDGLDADEQLLGDLPVGTY